jgi:signal transduction histidine kinase
MGEHVGHIEYIERGKAGETDPLRAKLRQDCLDFERRTRVPVRLVVLNELPAPDLSSAAALNTAVCAVLRAMEEHADTSSVVVSLFTVPDRLVAAVCADGASGAVGAHGDGLAAVGEQLSRVGGELHISSGDDGEVTVRAWIPTPG